MAAPIFTPNKSVQRFAFIHPSSTFNMCVIFGDSHLTGMVFSVALICISQMIIVVERVFVCLFSFCMSSLEKYLFMSFVYFRYSAHFLIGFFVLFC